MMMLSQVETKQKGKRVLVASWLTLQTSPLQLSSFKTARNTLPVYLNLNNTLLPLLNNHQTYLFAPRVPG